MASGTPDWYSSVAMYGKFAEEGEDDKYITVGVDALGNMLALMQGKLDDVYTPIAVDAQGVMRANIILQDLIPLTIRSIYGRVEEKPMMTRLLLMIVQHLLLWQGKEWFMEGLFISMPGQDRATILSRYGLTESKGLFHLLILCMTMSHIHPELVICI